MRRATPQKLGTKWLATALAALLASLWLAGTAAAHAELVRSEQSPDQVTLWFDRELDADRSSLEIYYAEGRRVEGGTGGVDLDDLDRASMMVRLPAPLPTGAYSVRWRAVDAVDGDATQGLFTFGVGKGAQTTSPPPLEPIESVTESPAPPEAPLAPAPAPAADSGGGWPAAWLAAGLALVLALGVAGWRLRAGAER